jgi:hypothetical protein
VLQLQSARAIRVGDAADVRRGVRQDMARGSLETVAEAARRAQLELADAQYADIDGRWRALTIEVETTRMAANDLEKYHKARALRARPPARCARAGCTQRRLLCC